MADRETMLAQLDEAENALHQLATGTKVVEVDYDGHAHKYNNASASELRRHIRGLNKKLGNSVASGVRRVTF